MDAGEEMGLFLAQVLLEAIEGQVSTTQFLWDSEGGNAQPPEKAVLR